MRRTRDELLDDDPITLKEASELLLRGIVTVSALRAEIRRGNLQVEKIGKNLFTTPAAIREMRKRCTLSQPQSQSVPYETGRAETVELQRIASDLRAGRRPSRRGIHKTPDPI